MQGAARAAVPGRGLCPVGYLALVAVGIAYGFASASRCNDEECRVITSWNPAAERMYGYSPQEAIGRPGACLTPRGREKEFFANLDSINIF